QIDVHVTKTGYNPGQTTVTIDRSAPVAANFTLTAIGIPSASTGGSQIIGNDIHGLTFETDISILDANGNVLTGLSNSAFSIDKATLMDANNAALPIASVTQNSINFTSNPSRSPVSAF